ncbi:hypothetical protein BJY01DRAFT_254030 [Aspergillus pseudoustus]|uniref:F-box domain-containing protein n=1 Tax=Aspergillus pseudoustus TaxID=1810923 RepID=A0ABR4IW24_9EURO
MISKIYQSITTVVKLIAFIILLLADGLYHETRLIPRRWERTIVNSIQASRAGKLKRSPSSRPILLNKNINSNKNDTTSGRAVGFHHLPFEIQQQIYDLALPPQRLLIQPEFRDNRIFSRIGTFPSNRRWNRWKRNKHIRDDSDPPSDDFARALAKGACYLDQSPEPLDPGVERESPKRRRRDLICGFAGSVTAEQRRGELVPVSYVDLLRVDRRCYAVALDDLYARHTISFFGSEMLTLFMDNTSVEGMERIRYVHLGIPLPRRGAKARKATAVAMARMAELFPGLEEIDVEVALLWDAETHGAQDVSGWLWNEAFASLRGLRKFVLKVSVLKTILQYHIAGDCLRPVLDPIKLLSDEEYIALKKRVTR